MIIVIIALVVICGFLIYKLCQKHEIDTKQKEIELNELNKLKQINETLNAENNKLNNNISSIQFGIIMEQKRLKENQDINNNLEDKIQSNRDALQNTIEQNQEISEQAFNSYQQILETKYEEIENEFDSARAALLNQLDEIKEELDKLSSTRAAAHEAILREKEVKDNKDNYRLLPSESDLTDSRRLEIVKRELNKPRILSMLIWQTYWQPLAKKQFPLIIQSKTKCGIYKITNITTDECYIGQSVDIYKRWCEHCKCGLGIDTPPGNKLYKAIQEYGLDNFTFELIEECEPSELNEKEKYFISLYQADTYGYNSNIGVNK